MTSDIRRLLNSSFLRFCYVGAAGFITDATILMLLVYQFGSSLVTARLISFSIALTVTWLLNRHFTFYEKKSPEEFNEWLRYAIINGIGGAINLGTYFFVISLELNLITHPFIALVISSAVALIFNYWGSRLIVFRAD
ncbi:hypothetical protein BOW51_04770 [Solemya velesiana gill symbiont]|uniref:GtrA/DPMS transmembrane domain-containing protein n=2 Tax=Solemya velesiana gill symbiont TaxID=1918948 RepID=A0A1T2KW35_9GAMM|nr:hypothetical protein BOW51_04770 [Solemya velesiana gill symbiont]